MISHYSLTKRRVGSGASYGAIAHDEHARKAVQKALAQMHDTTVGSVLLFLSSSYAHNPQNAIKEAAKAAGTPQVFGCCAMGLLTEQEWLLDVEGAVAAFQRLELRDADRINFIRKFSRTNIMLAMAADIRTVAQKGH